MNITFQPQTKRSYVNTNLGEFRAGESMLITKESDIAEAQRLVANGDFVDSNAGSETAKPRRRKKAK